MNIITANTPATAAEYKGLPATITMTNGDVLTGTFLSVNSKGWNLIVDGATVSRSLSKVTMVEVTDSIETNDDGSGQELEPLGVCPRDCEDHSVCEDEFHDDESTDQNATDGLVAQLEGATTAELAEAFGIEAKALRVSLRALGMGVGKGRRYHLDAHQIATVKAHIG